MPAPTQEDTVQRLSRLDTSTLPADGGDRYNRLVFSRSPYLLQHAENPLDWYPWGEEAFARARAEDRPVFISIGYATCHWCHVMAHESFEDPEVARLVNRDFVAIKIDREERPDIDSTYMAVCQMMTGSGGWPLNLVLTPDKKPFFAATYLPKTSRRGMTGFTEVMAKIAELWRSDRSRLLQTGEEVQRLLREVEGGETGEAPLSEAPLRTACEHLAGEFDRQFAGFGRAPKFPMPHNLSLLLRGWRRTGEEKYRAMATQTLQAMRLGGIYDQIGFGLHRYSVDRQWLVPHFEKMLYDQALLVLAALDASQATGDPFFRQLAEEVLEYVERDLSAPDGGFCSGEDADSEGEEGTFYLWTPAEVIKILGEEEGTVFCRAYGITEEGNFEGRNIPHLPQDVAALAAGAGVEAETLAEILARGRRQLFAARSRRVRPLRDDKVITAWNGLMVAAFARAGAVLGRGDLVRSAAGAADFLLNRLRTPQGRLLRRYRQGEAAIPGFLEDYAFLVWGLLELYQAGFDTRHLDVARELTEAMEALFADGRGGFYETGADAEAVLTRGRSLQDGALPSGTSAAILNLLRLARLTGDTAMESRGEESLRRHLPQIERYPSAYCLFLAALDEALGPRTEVVLGSPDDTPPRGLLQAIHGGFRPGVRVLLARPGDRRLQELAPATAGKMSADGQPAAWVCRENSCLPPVTEPDDLRRLLENGGSPG